MKTKIIFVLVYSFLISSRNGFSQGTSMLTLKQAVETGIVNNLQVLQTGLQVETDELDWKQSRLNLLPNLNGTGNNGLSQGRSIDPFTNAYSNQKIGYASYGLNSSVVLFNGFLLRNTVRQTELTYKASVMDFQQAKDDLTIDIILAYLEALNNEELLLQLRIQAELTGKQVERLIIMEENGAIAPSILSDLRGEYASNQLAMLDMQNSLESTRITLAQLMNVPYDKSMQLEKLSPEAFLSQYVGSAEAIYTAALDRFPQVKAAELRRQSAEKAILAAKGYLFPTLTLNGGANTNYSNAARSELFLNTTEVVTTDFVMVSGNKVPVVRQQDNFRFQKISYGNQLNNNLSTFVSLNLRIPIFNSFQARNRVKLAQIDLKNQELIAKNSKTRLQQFIEQAFLNMTTAWERYRVLLEQVNAYKESFRAAEIRFNSGIGTSIDFLTAKNNLDRAMSNLISVKYNYLLRIKILDYYQGKLSL